MKDGISASAPHWGWGRHGAMSETKGIVLFNRTQNFLSSHGCLQPKSLWIKELKRFCCVRKSKITKFYQIPHLATGFCVWTEQHQQLICCPWNWQNHLSRVLPDSARTGGFPDVNMQSALEKTPASAQTSLICDWNPHGKGKIDWLQ